LHTTNTPSTKITLLSVGNTGETNRWRFFVEIKDNDGAVVSNEEVFGPSQIVEVKNGANPRPEVSFSMDKSSIKVGDTINFVADARDPKGERIPDSAFKWDFDGDNIFEDTSSGPVVSRRYELPGEYEVRLKVVFRGLTTSETQKVFVERTSKLPLAAFTYEAAGRKVDFDASNSKIDTTVAGNNLDLAWDFDTSVDTDGDGVKDNDVQATEKETSFVYAEAKTYEAKLVVEDKTGGEDQVVRGIVITPSGRVTSGGSGSGGSSRQLEAVRSLPLTSNAPITTLELITLDQIVPKNGNLDITAIIKNADGTIYSGDVRFEVLQGSAQILPQEVEAVAGRAKTTITGLGEGPLLIRATATDTFSGNLAEALNLQVQ
jgi:PKD repeat protein